MTVGKYRHSSVCVLGPYGLMNVRRALNLWGMVSGKCQCGGSTRKACCSGCERSGVIFLANPPNRTRIQYSAVFRVVFLPVLVLLRLPLPTLDPSV